MPKSSLHHTLCSSGGRFYFGCDDFPSCPTITQQAATIRSLCSLLTYMLDFLDKNYLSNVRAEHITCLVQTIEGKMFWLLWLTIIMTSTKLCVMNWSLANHFRRKKPNNTFKWLCAHSFLLHFILPLTECWLVHKSKFFRKYTRFYISFHIKYMSLINHIACFLYSFLTQQLRN